MGAARTLSDQPRVSVIVPTRNRRPLLRELLEALAKQSFDDFEVIVVDDGSADGSPEEVAKSAQSGAPVRLVQGTGDGAVAARLAGVEAARGEYLAFTDDDCVPHDSWLAAGVAALEAGADVVQGVTRPHGAVRPLDRTIWVERHDGLYNTCNVFYRRAAYDAVGGFQPAAGNVLGFRPGRRAKNLGFGEDALLGWRVRRAGRAAFAPDAIVEHHVFPPDVRDAIRRAWMTGAFPALIGEIPELRETALAHRFFLGTGRVPLYAAAALAVVGRRRAAAACLALWVGGHARGMRRASLRRAALGLPGELAIDGTIAVALLTGSVRARQLVL
ncbi:MAG: glycosyltransferase family 2 protein [Acidimicrobiia bacterium]|nr:glycosyltransferase family 2 protein [Acidimicrobiia bacterium]